MKKKLLCALLALVCLVSLGVAETLEEQPVLTVDGAVVTYAELRQAVRLELFIGALRCAGYGYALDIVDPLTIEDEMDKVIFDLENKAVIRRLAAENGIVLTDEDLRKARETAEEEWRQYRAIINSDSGMAYLPAGRYVPSSDPEATVTRYMASFGLTEDVLFSRACDDRLSDKLQEACAAGMEGSEDDLLMAYIDWTLAAFDEAEITLDASAVLRLQAELWDE